MFCGRLPFLSTDPIELVHAHIAQKPPLPESIWSGPELSRDGGAHIARALSSIILRLMSKNKEDRYQSAAGIIIHMLCSDAY
jgi:histidine kinase